MKIPGAAAATLTEAGLPATPLAVTTIAEVPGGVSYGTWKLICDGPTYNNGTARPPSETVTVPTLVGSGSPAAFGDARIVKAMRFELLTAHGPPFRLCVVSPGSALLGNH